MESTTKFWTDRIIEITQSEERAYGIKSACFEIELSTRKYIEEIKQLKDDVRYLQEVKKELEDDVAENFYNNHKFPESWKEVK